MPEPIPTAPSVATGEVAVTERTRLRRISEQGSHRIADVHAVLDSGFVCHLGLVMDGWPMVVPTSYGRRGQHLFLHGSVASRSLRAARTPIEVCVTVTHIDGLVLARSVFEHAVNYRCAMIYGVPEVLNDPAEKLIGLQTISDQVAPGQWEYARSPSTAEIAATTVLRMTLDQCAGEIPLRSVRLDPVADPALPAGIPVPGHLTFGQPAPGSTPIGELAPQISPL